MSTPFLSFNPGDLIEDSHVEQFIEPIQNLESGKPWYSLATGAANTFEVTLDPAPAAYEAGMIVNFKANEEVTGATTLNVNSLGAQSLQKEGATTLLSGDIVAGQMVTAIYDGSKFQMMSPALNPTITVASPTQNVLVYAETRAEQPTSTITSLSLPSFTFSSSKKYLLEMTVSPGTSLGFVQLSFSDGTSTYVYPTSTTYIRARQQYDESPRMCKILPTLSGLHTLEIQASYLGSVEVKLYEVNDNLVYADFTPSEIGATVTSFTLEDFTAEADHRYLLTMTAYQSSGAYTSASCYLTDGSAVEGIPHPDPTTQVVKGPFHTGVIEVSKLLTGLSGVYDVIVRRNYSAGVSIRIHDIT